MPASSTTRRASSTIATCSAKRERAASGSAPAAWLFQVKCFADAKPAPVRPDKLLRRAQRVGVAVDLQPGHPEAWDPIAVDRTLPGEELLDRQVIATAGF